LSIFTWQINTFYWRWWCNWYQWTWSSYERM